MPGCKAGQPKGKELKNVSEAEFKKIYNAGMISCDTVYHHQFTKDLRHAATAYKADPNSVTDEDMETCDGVFYFSPFGSACGDQRASNNTCDADRCYFFAKYGKCDLTNKAGSKYGS
mmetsp:Transcript_41215/g.89834  ORF Transcript_41215/g.89834 Transcript_41215/m.89834 type:complete len:117 (+) Transcript_41215:61-411(+)|eukprot:CAMPEP_0204252816 /NCGR_PEP_ID=MMETSP0468-20130131/1463_1 /ASSEMBLY_ACC=CAM_ASM_000383 /TAXON_ID=2969 /ORGANISM="Oxyrrhis marina" /LENGTH=116 /DNA_ID=CAMNT_0051226301 /DNA_START=61 /DNA_END=411 /DNA_ORIENTATION=-